MDFLKLLLRTLCIYFISLLLLSLPPAQADFTGADAELDAGAGAGNLYSLGTGGQLKFDSGNVGFSLSKQFSPSDTSNESSPLKHTDNWTGTLEQEFGDKLSFVLEYDRYTDSVEALQTNGGKLEANYGDYHLSFRLARNLIDQSFNLTPNAPTPANERLGAYVYQKTIEVSFDYAFDEKNSISPKANYSFFSPDLPTFQTILNAHPEILTRLSNFADTLQSFQLWVIGADYSHQFTEQLSSSLVLTFSHLIIGTNPSIEFNPSITKKWSSLFKTDLGFDYNYLPGAPTWMVNLALKFSFGKNDEKKVKNKGDTDESDE